MKKLLLLGILSVVVVFSFGQSLQLRKNTGELISNGDAIHVYADTSTATIYAHVFMKNISSSNLNVRLKYYIISEISGTENTYCWGSCYTPPGPNPSIAVPVTKGDSALFDGEYIPHSLLGTTTIKYTFFDDASPNDSISVTVSYHATGVSIQDLVAKINFSNAYPNPANAYTNFTYDIPKGINNATLIIYDLLGSVVTKQAIADKNGTLRINTAKYTDGIYFYSLIAENKTLFTRKLIVKH